MTRGCLLDIASAFAGAVAAVLFLFAVGWRPT